MELEFQQITPKEALEEIHEPESKLVNLVTAGYDLRGKEKKNPIKATEVEYDYPNDRAMVFLAKQEGRVVGSVTLILWPDSKDDKRGGRFWPKLRELDPDVANKAKDINPLACDIGGVVTLPEVRNKGVGKYLLLNAVRKANLSIIVGNTKTVEAVSLRRKLSEIGYRTFFGNAEITPGREQESTDDHTMILNTYYFAKEVDLLPEGPVFTYKGGIAPTIPNTTNFPEIIRKAFEPLIAAQIRLGDTITAMSPLISVRQEILE